MTLAAPQLAQPGGLSVTIRDALLGKVRAWDASRPRSTQRTVGASDIGHPCDRYLGHIAARTTPGTQSGDPWPPIVGTSVHEWVLTQAFQDDPRWLVAAKGVQIFPGVKGTVDLIDLETLAIIDHKVLGATALKKLRGHGPGVQYRTQVHMYGYGYRQRGVDIRHVAIAAWPRSGYMTGPAGLHVWTEPYNQAIAEAAWLRYQTIAAAVIFGTDDMPDPSDVLYNLRRVDGPCEWCPFQITKGEDPADGCPGAPL